MSFRMVNTANRLTRCNTSTGFFRRLRRKIFLPRSASKSPITSTFLYCTKPLNLRSRTNWSLCLSSFKSFRLSDELHQSGYFCLFAACGNRLDHCCMEVCDICQDRQYLGEGSTDQARTVRTVSKGVAGTGTHPSLDDRLHQQ